MLWVVIAEDRAGAGNLRGDNRGAHIDWLTASGDHVVRAGPFTTDDGSAMTGSMLVVDFPDRSAVEEWAGCDPYAIAGLFESVTIKAWKEVIKPD